MFSSAVKTVFSLPFTLKFLLYFARYVKSVEIYFVTHYEDFEKLNSLAKKISQTTSALNHIFDNVMFDCSTCNLKEICDEVDGMRELHFKTAKEKR